MFTKLKSLKINLKETIKNLEDKNLLFTQERLNSIEALKSQYKSTKDFNLKNTLRDWIYREENNLILYKIEITNFISSYASVKFGQKFALKLVNKGFEIDKIRTTLPVTISDVAIATIAKKLYLKNTNYNTTGLSSKKTNNNALVMFTLDENKQKFSTLDTETQINFYKQALILKNIVSYHFNQFYIKRDHVLSAFENYYNATNKLYNKTCDIEFKDLPLEKQLPYIQDILIASTSIEKSYSIKNHINNYLNFFDKRNGFKQDYEKLNYTNVM